MEEPLGNIKEVQEGGKHLANWYLGHGYVLLAIQPGAWPKVMPHSNPNGPQYYVRKNPIYVLGRPVGVDEAPPFRGKPITPGFDLWFRAFQAELALQSGTNVIPKGMDQESYRGDYEAGMTPADRASQELDDLAR